MLVGGGVSIISEDWSAVGQYILDLRAKEINVSSHLSAHPMICHELHHQVQITDANDYSVKMLGATDKQSLLGSLAKVLPYSVFTFDRWVNAISSGERYYRGRNSVRRLDGSSIDMLVLAALPEDLKDLKSLTVYALDISAHTVGRSAVAQTVLGPTTHVAAMGELTASIAHEVRNPLAAIATNASACLRWLRRADPNIVEAEEAIASVIENVIRAQQVVDQTSSALKGRSMDITNFDIFSFIRDIVLVISGDLQRSQVEIDIQSADSLPEVCADQFQIQQAILNLVRNALDAMSKVDHSRRIRIIVGHHQDGICVEISDNGPGIEPQKLKKLFDPFYSTKTHGIGIGLAVCRRFVEANGGKIWVKSTFGEGASFFFTLRTPKVAVGSDSDAK
jgi:signal transduction histidine kinase